jgi:hypothetical protein
LISSAVAKLRRFGFLVASAKTADMKPRHVAALALVGWYLLVPPRTKTWWIGEERYDDAAPLSRWTIERSFDKAEPCEAARLNTQQQAGDAATRMNHAVCVASDDPRLKQN